MLAATQVSRLFGALQAVTSQWAIECNTVVLFWFTGTFEDDSNVYFFSIHAIGFIKIVSIKNVIL